MKKITLFETPFAKSRSINTMLDHALTFMIKSSSDVQLRPEQLNDIANVKILSNTPISKMFQDLILAEKHRSFVVINLSTYRGDIPEILALDDIVIDGKVIPNLPVPASLQKCWINITPVVGKQNSYNGMLNITDAATLANLVVRAALVTSYNDNDIWLNPKHAAYVIENYSLTVSNVLRQIYNLDVNECLFVQTIFAAYYAQCLGGSSSPLEKPPLLMRCQFLGSGKDIVDRLEIIKPHRENNGNDVLTPTKISNILAVAGPPRMNKFKPQNLYRFMSSSSIDSQVMMIGVDYPPYWLYQMLRLASGYKNPVMSNAIHLLGHKNKLSQFVQELQQSNIITQKVKR